MAIVEHRERINITVDRFLESCTPVELKSIERKLQLPEYQKKLNKLLYSKTTMPEIARCKNCGQPFEKMRIDQKYCSDKCRQANFHSENGSNYEKQKLESRDCKECGTPFIPKTKRSFYCSSQCYHKAYRREKILAK